MIFRNFQEATFFYKYPSSHRFGTIGNEKGVIRSYSNGEKGDIIKNDGKVIYYKLKNEKVKAMFKKSIESQQKIRFFRKINAGVKDMGNYRAEKFYKDFVKLVK